MRRLDVPVVVGAGPGGLSAGYGLKRAGVRAKLLERGDKVGMTWRTYYDTLRLNSPRVLSSLPGRSDAELALQDAWRVLAPDGVLLVWEPRLPNPLNQHTTLIGRDLLRRATAGAKIDFRPTTVLPALARRLGGRTEDLYPRLARIAAIRTHRLACVRRPGGSTPLGTRATH